MRRSALAAVYLAVFVDLLGFGIILPALPFYAETLGASGLWLGIVFSSYSVAQLFGATILGRLSDRVGRRPVLLASIAGSTVSLTLTGLAPTLILLAGARALAGLFGGSISAAQAYIADVTEPEERARYMGYLGASIGLGFVAGPALGALLAPWGFAAAAFAAAGLALVNLVLAALRLEESLPPEARSGLDRDSLRQRLAAAAGRPELVRIIGARFLIIFAFVAMETTLAYLGARNFGLDQRGFGLLLVLAGVVGVTIQGTAIGPLSKALGERRMTALGLALMGVTIATLPVAGRYALMAVIIAGLAAGHALALPGLSTLLSRASRVGEQGATLGLGNSAAAAARAAGPVTAGWLFDLRAPLPFLVAAGLALVAAAAIFGVRLEEP